MTDVVFSDGISSWNLFVLYGCLFCRHKCGCLETGNNWNKIKGYFTSTEWNMQANDKTSKCCWFFNVIVNDLSVINVKTLKCMHKDEAQIEVPRNVRNSKSENMTMSGEMVSTLEQVQVPNGTGSGVRRSKRPLLASHTRCNDLWKHPEIW